MKLHRRGFIAGILGALFIPASKIKAEPVVDTETAECEYFIAKHLEPKRLIFLNDKEVHEVFEMLAAKEPGVTVSGFVKCYVRNTYNNYVLTVEGNKEFATLKTIRMDGKIRWELID